MREIGTKRRPLVFQAQGVVVFHLVSLPRESLEAAQIPHLKKSHSLTPEQSAARSVEWFGRFAKPDHNFPRFHFSGPPCGVDERRVPHCEGNRVTRELNVLALFKGDERFIFVYDDESRQTLVDELRHKAADPTLAISWFDAAVLTERIKNPEPSLPASDVWE